MTQQHRDKCIDCLAACQVLVAFTMHAAMTEHQSLDHEPVFQILKHASAASTAGVVGRASSMAKDIKHPLEAADIKASLRAGSRRDSGVVYSSL